MALKTNEKLEQLEDIFSYVTYYLPEQYVKYLEKLSKRNVMYKTFGPDAETDYYRTYLKAIEHIYDDLAELLGIKQSISERISELNL